MLSFTFHQDPPSSPPAGRRSVLVTGAAGRIGSYFAQHAGKRFDLRLFVHRVDDSSRALEKYGEVRHGDLSDLATATEACRGVEAVLHLAGDPSPQATWDELLPANIVATYNVFTAARAAGCRKIVFASSIHAVSGYPGNVQVKTSEPVNPADLYGVSKCFGEALGRYFSTQEGLSVIAIRIGAFQPSDRPEDPNALKLAQAFVSRRDLQQLIEKCLLDERLQFAIFNGLSANTFNRLDIADARELVGYEPRDDFFAINPQLDSVGIAQVLHTHD